MTKLLNKDENPFREFLVSNLPPKIKSGTSKENSNIYLNKTILALKKDKYINFNSLDRISLMIFDIDKMGGKTAKEYFKNIEGLLDFIMDKIGFEPTYILETDKGFHFAFGLMNHVFTKNKKATALLRAIKIALTKLLGCDEAASHRLSGVWRNPLIHPYYFSEKFNYELKDFFQFLPKFTSHENRGTSCIDINGINFQEGERNKKMFSVALAYANSQVKLTLEDLVAFLSNLNKEKGVGLEEPEIRSCATSAFKYWTEGRIKLKKPKSGGAMEFEKIKNLGKEEYFAEVKRRQRLSAERTNAKRDKSKLKASSQRASQVRTEKLKKENMEKIRSAISSLEKKGIKLTFLSISIESGLNRITVSKYAKEYHLI